MKKLFSLSKKTKVMLWIFIVSFFALITIIYTSGIMQISDFYGETKDGYIELHWEKPYSLFDKDVVVRAFVDDELIETVTLSNGESSYKFKNGEHGKLYTFAVNTVNRFGQNDIVKHCYGFFVNYKDMPNLPIINIETDDRVLPTYERADKPNNVEGETITNNYYVKGNMDMLSYEENIHTYNDRINIKVRGNTSAFAYRTSYKIKLSKKVDLFNRGDDKYIDDEYLLLAKDLRWAIGTYFSEYFGLEWQPKYEVVNLIINGDYRGCYLLVESVKKSEGRLNISDSGYLFENDPYWWNNNNEYFKTDYQFSTMAYTMVYPKYSNENVQNLKQYINEFEHYLFSYDERCFDYIDSKSFASWLLVNDVLACGDSAGTNMYLVKNDNDFSISGEKIKMVTNWDFDSFLVTEEWPYIQLDDRMYFKTLLSFDSFYDTYYEEWLRVKDCILDDFYNFIDNFYLVRGNDIEESWRLTEEKFTPIPEEVDLLETINQLKESFSNRIDWINENITIRKESRIYCSDEDSLNVELIQNYSENKYIVAVWSEQNGQDDLVWYDLKYNNNKYEAIIDLNNHENDGEINVHVYEVNEQNEKKFYCGKSNLLIKSVLKEN